MKIIAGLGNPTKEYVGTRHNIGFDGVTAIADKYRISVKEKAHNALVGKGVINGERVLLMKPQTYMNLSGEAIGDAMRFYKIDPEDIIVIYDDVNLEPGAIRVREGGSAGGHNGMKNIIQHVGTEKFPRVRIGVGEKPKGYDLADYVLGHFTKDDQVKLVYKDGDTVTPSTITVLSSDPGYFAGYNAESFYQLDFDENPFDGTIEVAIIGEPLPGSTVTLIATGSR